MCCGFMPACVVTTLTYRDVQLVVMTLEDAVMRRWFARQK